MKLLNKIRRKNNFVRDSDLGYRKQRSPRDVGIRDFPWYLSSASKAQVNDPYQGWVYAAVNLRADQIGKIKFELFEQRQGDRIRVESDPLLNLLNRPDPETTKADFYGQVSTFLDLFGTAFAHILRSDSSEPVALMLLDPTRVRIDYDNLERPVRYEFTNLDGNTKRIEPADMIRFRQGARGGRQNRSLVDAARAYIAIEQSGNNLTYAAVNQGILPQGIFKPNINIPSPTRWDLFVGDMTDSWRRATHLGSPIVVNESVDFKPMSLKPDEGQVVDSKVFVRDSILAIFGVPKVLLGISETTNRSVAEVANLVFAEQVIAGRMRQIVNAIALKLIPADSNRELTFTSPIPADKEFELRELAESVNKWRTPNEARQAQGLDPIAGGDDIYQPLNLRGINEDVVIPESQTPQMLALQRLAADDVEEAVNEIIERKNEEAKDESKS